MAQDAREKLISFLDRRAFRPVVQAKPEDFPESKRNELRHVQRATEDARERYRGYGSARKVYEMYRDDLSSEAARKVNRELDDLGLPTLPQFEDEFEQLAEEVGAKH